jgi:hypothetical protein
MLLLGVATFTFDASLIQTINSSVNHWKQSMLKLLSLHRGHGPFTVVQNNNYVLVCCVDFHEVQESSNTLGPRNFHAAFHIVGKLAPQICITEDVLPVIDELVKALQLDADLLKTIVGLRSDDDRRRRIKSVQVLRVYDRAGLLFDQLDIYRPVSPLTE